ncbi:MAG: BolA family protein [Hydrotalea sp.]|nr:BolA family protein [Hydrotalea sp.]
MANTSSKNSTHNMVDIIRATISNGMAVRDPLRDIIVVNDSARHAGHAGVRESSQAGDTTHSGQTHFIVTIISDDFIGLSRIDRQRKIYNLLAVYMPKPIHALNLSCLTIAEAATRQPA